jgi:hypothetical protein
MKIGETIEFNGLKILEIKKDDK